MSRKLLQHLSNGDGIPKTVTTSSGVVSFNTTSVMGIIRQVYVKAASSDTLFDVSFTDRKGRVVKNYTDEEGILNDFPVFPVEGIYTISIANASNDEAFEFLFIVEEQ